MSWKITTPDGHEHTGYKLSTGHMSPEVIVRSREKGATLLGAREFTVEWVEDDDA